MAPAVVFLHGFTNTGRSWDPVLAALRGRYAALAPDIRGHGSASERRPVTLQAVIADVAGLVDDRFTLVGYSMGGRIALHVALALPDRVERLVLIGASPGLADEAERVARRQADERLADEIERSSLPDFARRWAASPLFADQPPEVRRRMHRDRLRNDTGGLAAALRGLGTGALPPLWDRLGELAMPSRFVVGERDGKFREIALRMRELAPAADLVMVKGAGHAVHLENPKAVAEALAGD